MRRPCISVCSAEVHRVSNGQRIREGVLRNHHACEGRMTGRLSFRIFAHSWISDWNHGNAHFLRGLASELVRLGHEVRCYEERDGWSIRNLASEGNGAAAEAESLFHQAFPMLDVRFYSRGDGFRQFVERELRSADMVLIHEWNAPEVISQILSLKKQRGFRALLH